MSLNTPSQRYLGSVALADQPPNVQLAHQLHEQGILDLNQAVAALKVQVSIPVVTAAASPVNTSVSFNTIIGNLLIAQLPLTGVSGTIPLAALTVGGTSGSLTFTNGLLTAFTPPT